MKNKLSIVLVLAVFMSMVLGCGISDRIQKAVEGDSKSTKSGNSTSKGDESLTDKAIDSVADGETTGIAECDEVIQIIEDQTKNAEDGWGAKAMYGFIFAQIKKSIKESVEKNKDDKAKVIDNCREFKKQVEKALAEQKSK